MKQEIKIRPAFDKRNADPKKNDGNHGAEILFMYGDERGVVQFLLHTNWRMRDGQEALTAQCQDLGGKPCFYDGSRLDAERIYKTLLEKGSEGVWEELAKYHGSTFGKEKPCVLTSGKQKEDDNA
jgi:hypothetical protein